MSVLMPASLTSISIKNKIRKKISIHGNLVFNLSNFVETRRIFF